MAALLQIPLDDIVLTYVGNIYQLIPDDVQLFDPQGTPIGTLFERYPFYQQALQEQAHAVTTSRIMVSAEHRKRTAEAGEELKALLYEQIKT